ncbi:MAG: SWIM zinc finger family protein [Chloroflexi bacterium]|nr:SWIM zinc finger family protein [Chloroflexota bacterium]MBV9134874.1 SWIM zinc finger family protein [Chloroflexota bacterium]MBV9896673.1 SWIM zinc finger family protein [Chloroflexota bacterium]
MGITISADDPRSIRAIEIAANAGRWRVTRDGDGRELFRVPSQNHPGVLYLVTQSSCTCADFLHGADLDEDHVCKHILAVRLYSELVRAQERPATTSRRSHLRVVH